MNRKNNKKGFTIVELVIVIAVIAILAGVLIPTFSGVVEKANESKADQAAKNAYTDWLVEYDFTTENLAEENGYFLYGGEYYPVTNGQIDISGEEATSVDANAVIVNQ